MRRAKDLLTVHFEAFLYASFWISASLLATMAGRPWIGAIGFVTVVPVLALYVARARRARGRSP
ncbi:MAG: hypothetical protein ACLQVI_30150 [Polyangiaceae bacterium]